MIDEPIVTERQKGLTVDLVKARYFLKIVDTGSMARAGEILNISPSALSKATRALEHELGIKLVTVSGKNLVVTEEGLMFAKEARLILRQVDDLHESLRKNAQPKQKIRIATFEVFSTYFLSVLKELPWDAQSIVLHDSLPGHIERAVADGVVDFGITYQPVPIPELDFLKVLSIEMGVYTNASAFKGVAQPELPFVVPVEPMMGQVTRARGLDGWPLDAYERKVKFEVTMMESALELVRQGRAAGFFPKFIVNEHNRRMIPALQLVRRKSPYPNRLCMTDVYIIKRRSDLESQLIKQIARGIRKVCG